MLHKEILSEKQARLLPLIRKFSDDFGLVGGTAIALHLGHRESIDFDLFTKDPETEWSIQKIRNRFKRGAIIGETLKQRDSEFTFNTTTGVKFTFFQFPFKIPFTIPLDSTKESLKIPSLLTLAAMKAFALGRRAKWKDYVDLYFILKQHSFAEITQKAHKIFGNEFNEKLLRIQLAEFDDINYSEAVTYRIENPPTDKEVKEKLLEVSLSA